MKEYPVLRGRVQYDERIRPVLHGKGSARRENTPYSGEGFCTMREYPVLKGKGSVRENTPCTPGEGSARRENTPYSGGGFCTMREYPLYFTGSAPRFCCEGRVPPVLSDYILVSC